MVFSSHPICTSLLDTLMFKILNPFAPQCYNVVLEALVTEIRQEKEVKVMMQVGRNVNHFNLKMI